jgi:ABC-type amino acid transport substrate-binding protein
MTDDMKYTVFYTDENGQLVPNGEKLLSITEIAKYRNIPTERLRYYDKIGLLRPDYVDKLTGRRFYSAQQCEKLGTIKELRRLNLSLNARKVDILITAMSITEEREKVVDFSRPYYKSPSQLLVSQKAEVVRTVGVLRGSVDELFARRQYKQAKVVAYSNQMEALMDLQFERLDAVFGPRIELEYGLTPDQASLFHFTGPVFDDLKFFGPGIGMAVRQNDPLLAQVNEAIEQIRAEGLWKKHSDRYFKVDIWAY